MSEVILGPNAEAIMKITDQVEDIEDSVIGRRVIGKLTTGEVVLEDHQVDRVVAELRQAIFDEQRMKVRAGDEVLFDDFDADEPVTARRPSLEELDGTVDESGNRFNRAGMNFSGFHQGTSSR